MKLFQQPTHSRCYRVHIYPYFKRSACNERRRSAMRGLATRYRETLVVRATRRTATRMFSKHDTQVGRYKIGRKSNSTRYEGRHSSLDRPLRCFLHPSNSTRPPRRRWHRSSYREASDHDDGDRERGKNHARVNQSPVVCILRSCGKGDDETTSGCGPCSVPRKEKERERDEGKRTSQWQQNLSKFLPANGALSMRMISARENGTRHHETRGLLPPLPLSPHLSHHLLYETRTKHDDGNDAWRRYWLGPKHPSYLNRSTCNARCGRCNGSRARDCPTMPISRRTRISEAREQLLGKAI